MDILLIVAFHPVYLRTKSIIERQLLVGTYVTLSDKHSPVGPSSEAYFGRAVSVLLVSMVREAHHIALINGIDSDFGVDIEGVGATDLVINLPQECL